MTPRRARLVLVLVGVVVLGVGVVAIPAWQPAWEWATTKRKLVESPTPGPEGVRSYHTFGRWSGKYLGVSKIWYLDSGFKYIERLDDGSCTWWGPDGRIEAQFAPHGSVVSSPPWLWGVTDQTAPSMPAWMKDDEQWQRALDAQD